MTRTTIAGEASVSLLCETVRLSRAAFYAEARRARGEAPPSTVTPLPRRPRYTSAEVVLLRIREILARENSTFI